MKTISILLGILFWPAGIMFLDEPLVGAVQDGDVGKVKSLLAWGASPDASPRGRPALVQAAAGGETAMVRSLLAHGARIDIPDRSTGQTALQCAQKNGHAEVVTILKQARVKR